MMRQFENSVNKILFSFYKKYHRLSWSAARAQFTKEQTIWTGEISVERNSVEKKISKQSRCSSYCSHSSFQIRSYAALLIAKSDEKGWVTVTKDMQRRQWTQRASNIDLRYYGQKLTVVTVVFYRKLPNRKRELFSTYFSTAAPAGQPAQAATSFVRELLLQATIPNRSTFTPFLYWRQYSIRSSSGLLVLSCERELIKLQQQHKKAKFDDFVEVVTAGFSEELTQLTSIRWKSLKDNRSISIACHCKLNNAVRQ